MLLRNDLNGQPYVTQGIFVLDVACLVCAIEARKTSRTTRTVGKRLIQSEIDYALTTEIILGLKASRNKL